MKPKENPTEDVEKASHTTPKPPAIDYSSGVNLIILFVGLFLAALCVGLVRLPVSILAIASILLLNYIIYLHHIHRIALLSPLLFPKLPATSTPSTM